MKYWIISFGLLTAVFPNFVSTKCRLPHVDFANGRILYEKSTDFNLTWVPEYYVMDFACDPGYQKSEPAFIVCFHGNWAEEPPTCTKLECPAPPVISNSRFRIDSVDVDGRPIVSSEITYDCVHGFMLMDESQSSLKCIMNGTQAAWDGIMPECVVGTMCPDPGKSRDGWRKGRCCRMGHVVTYSCKEEFELIGSRRIKCLAGGIWSSPRPKCKPLEGTCPDPPFVSNGMVEGLFIGDYYKPYDEAEVVCNSGYAFYGISQYVECTETLEWDEEFGNCTETFCDRPQIPENGTIMELLNTSATRFPHKFELNYACNQGFRLIGPDFRQCNKEKWSGKDPYCEAIRCYDPGVPENGMRKGSDFNVGQKVVFSCFSGSTLLGSVERYCQPNGQWTGELTRCNYKSNYCPDPGIPTNGMKIGRNYNQGDAVKFQCMPGFSLVGNEEWECLENRTWSSEDAICLGQYDFDNEADVRNTLETVLEENVKEQEDKVREIVTLTSMMVLGQRSPRILDLSHSSGRHIFYFMFDASGSIRIQNFKISIEFAKALVKKVQVTERGVRVGAITFSSTTKIAFYPSHYDNTIDVLNALDKINYTSGGTATNSALQQMREGVIPLTKDVFEEKNIKSVIFILTDGKANTGGDPEAEAEKLKKAGVKIYCIGITGSFKKNSLYKIASSPPEDHVFILSNYRTLDYLVQKITNGSIDYSECGLGLEKVRMKGHRSRIIGGSPVVDPWPWMAALYITDNLPVDAQLRCGGSIIGKKWILTAAHCLFKEGEHLPRPKENIIIKLGLTHVEEHSKLQEFEPEKLHVHPNYNPVGYDNDLAIIELSRPIEYNQDVRPICLPPRNITDNTVFYKENEIAFATGWGVNKTLEVGQLLSINLSPVKHLKEVRLPIQPNERCKQSIKNQNLPEETFTKNMFCAGTGDERADTCRGDSGGPLMQSQVNSEGNVYWTEVGIVSSGFGCGQKGQYGIYTHVHELLLWIKQVINSTET